MQELLQSIAFAIAAILHGITGMGFPMIGTTALAFVMPLSQAVAMVALPSLVMSLFVIIANRNRWIASEIWHYCYTYRVLAITSIIGSIIGVGLLISLPSTLLYLIMAAVTLYYAAQGLLSLQGKLPELRVPTTTLSMAIFGLMAGVVGGATNAMSPILLMFLLSYSKDKNEIAKASNLCYLLGKLVQLVLLKNQFIAFDRQDWLMMLMLIIIAIGFLFVGIYLRNKLSISTFKALTYGVLLLLAFKIGHVGIQGLFS
ncbi:sulfite exporter TauE/SafE family protein [Moraxella cuniculi]|uniref:Probable membrane transporter protein n=1 Tax=Moraxella cuniculi TaxID=34061 RepID=A0A448GVR7_9GAMM|nr:sulfite exporter TauE/SafE family protein [Moraxella cuniculi]VEG12903.1 Sulfite exporter TauE/SafE [Moraxella cuniculi]